MKNVSLYELAWELSRAGVSPEETARRLDKHRATIYRWLKGIRYRGLHRFVREKALAKRQRHRRRLKTEVVLKIKRLRQETNWCGEKIVWKLQREGITVSRASVYRVLNRYFTLRSRWKKNQARGPQPKACQPRDVIQADTVDLGELFAYTAVDIFTREAAVVLGEDLTDEEGAKCLQAIFAKLGPCRIFPTDNGREFGKVCSPVIRRFAGRYRRIPARRKNENAYIESFHRSLRKECLGWLKYRRGEKEKTQALVDDYLVHYHTERPHLGLGLKTPAEVVQSHLR